MKSLPYCVYILKSQQDGLLYIGFTTDLHRRLTEHLRGLSDATAPRRPFDLLYCEYHVSKADALRREGYFKTTAGKKALKLMLREAFASGAEIQVNPQSRAATAHLPHAQYGDLRQTYLYAATGLGTTPSSA
jgi:putative endonuclease